MGTKIGDGECVDGNDNILYGLGTFRTKTATECADLCSRDFEDSTLVGFVLINSSVRQDYCRCLEGGEKISSVQDKQDNWGKGIDRECYGNDNFNASSKTTKCGSWGQKCPCCEGDRLKCGKSGFCWRPLTTPAPKLLNAVP